MSKSIRCERCQHMVTRIEQVEYLGQHAYAYRRYWCGLNDDKLVDPSDSCDKFELDPECDATVSDAEIEQMVRY